MLCWLYLATLAPSFATSRIPVYRRPLQRKRLHLRQKINAPASPAPTIRMGTASFDFQR
jgi:hypothetical protein